jgi:hypothetical protein
MSIAWHCRGFQSGDEQGILELYREVFQLELSPAEWQWLFRESPDGPAVISLVEQAGKIVGHYYVQPRKFWIAGQLCTAGYAGGTMLAAQARNVTTLIEMARQAYTMCKTAGIDWLYCFPNAQALPVRLKLLEWKQLPDAVEWDGALPNAAGPSADAGASSEVEVWREMPPQLQFDGTAQLTDDGLIRAQRSTAWIKWRYFDRPGGEYVLHTLTTGDQISGYAVTKRYRRDGVWYGHIVDWQLQAVATHCGADLINSVWRQLAEWQVERVSCWAAGQALLCKLLAAAGLSPTGRKNAFCYYDLEGPWSEQLAQGPQWRYWMADCDVY